MEKTLTWFVAVAIVAVAALIDKNFVASNPIHGLLGVLCMIGLYFVIRDFLKEEK